jgi:hypothetical protein
MNYGGAIVFLNNAYGNSVLTSGERFWLGNNKKNTFSEQRKGQQ